MDAFAPDAKLRRYWHPAASSSEVGDAPVGVSVLDEPIVLYRARGRVVALKDLCIHRGTPLSRGWLDDGCLVCAYHGWSFGPDGACVRIPALDPAQPIPRKARVPAYRVAERYGLVWVCLDEPVAPLPELPELEDTSLRTFPLYPEADGGGLWQTSAARMVENFLDSSHFAWVHTDVFGRRDMPRVPPFDVKRAGGELTWDVEIPVPSGDVMWGNSTHHYRFVFPFNAQLTRVMPDGTRLVVTMAVTPIGAKRIRRHVFISRDYALDRPDAEIRAFVRPATEQDRAVVESQRPEELPVDLAEELHIKGPDAPSVEFRRMLAEP
jgi:phenylpropionate dioxygenase-like ring-hydroxylating dioxygenase large terminal subunit